MSYKLIIIILNNENYEAKKTYNEWVSSFPEAMAVNNVSHITTITTNLATNGCADTC